MSSQPDPIEWQDTFDVLNLRLFRQELELRGLTEELEQLGSRIRDVEAENRDLKDKLRQHMVRLNKLDHTNAINKLIGNQQQQSSCRRDLPPLELFKLRNANVANMLSQGYIIEPCYSQDMNLGPQ